jgi:hypothetical protein
MTKVINLYGGPGVGKSTTAAGIFYHAKMKGQNAELVHEYVKSWAWQGIQFTPFDEAYLFGKQSRCESQLYGKVDLIVTDSPILLAAIYEEHRKLPPIIKDAAIRFIAYAEEHGVQYYNYLLKRHKPYNPAGRYQTEEEAKRLDTVIEAYLKLANQRFTVIESLDECRALDILVKTLC